MPADHDGLGNAVVGPMPRTLSDRKQHADALLAGPHLTRTVGQEAQSTTLAAMALRSVQHDQDATTNKR